MMHHQTYKRFRVIWNLWDSDNNTEKCLTCFIPCGEELVVYRRQYTRYTRGVFSFFFVLIFPLFHDVIQDGGVGGIAKGCIWLKMRSA